MKDIGDEMDSHQAGFGDGVSRLISKVVFDGAARILLESRSSVLLYKDASDH